MRRMLEKLETPLMVDPHTHVEPNEQNHTHR